MWESISEFFTTLGARFTSPHIIIDIIDILVVAFIVYKVLQLAVQTRAEQLLKGILIIIVIYAVADWLEMVALHFIMNSVLQIGILVIVILFQPEIRRALEQLGRSNVGTSLFMIGRDTEKEAENTATQHTVDTVSRALTELSLSKTGALIAFERKTKLGEVVATGTEVDSAITVDMIGTIFFPKTPLHDGAAIISHNRIRAAGCFLPLSQNFEISRELGTRHRAALGLSEISDAVIVVVSEETGKISLVENGQMLRGLTPEELRRRLFDALKARTAQDGSAKKKPHFFGGESK